MARLISLNSPPAEQTLMALQIKRGLDFVSGLAAVEELRAIAGWHPGAEHVAKVGRSAVSAGETDDPLAFGRGQASAGIDSEEMCFGEDVKIGGFRHGIEIEFFFE